MTVRPLVLLPDSQLRLASAPIATVDDAVRRLAEDMVETMYEASGIGLAAIQIGVPQRLVTIDVGKREEEGKADLKILLNPEILWASEETSVYEEGCLSIPDYFEEVTRPARVKARFTNLAGEPEEIDAEGLLATCLQHEIDHLNGVLFIDYLSKLKRDRVVRRFTKQARQKAREKE